MDTKKLQSDFKKLKHFNYSEKRIWEILGKRMEAGIYREGIKI